MFLGINLKCVVSNICETFWCIFASLFFYGYLRFAQKLGMVV